MTFEEMCIIRSTFVVVDGIDNMKRLSIYIYIPCYPVTIIESA